MGLSNKTRIKISKILANLILFLSLFTSLSVSKAQTNMDVQEIIPNYDSVTVFRDDFDGTSLNPDIWQIYLNDGMITVDSGWVTLDKPGSSRTFPYIHTKYNVLPPSGNFSVKIGIQYLYVDTHGNGFSVDDRLPSNGSYGSWSWQPTIYTVWQDLSEGYEIYDYSLQHQYYLPASELDRHDVEIRWLENLDEYYVDGALVNSVVRDNELPRPVDLWFGNPVIADGENPWSSFKIDYIEVVSLSYPPAPFNLPISYPGRENPSEYQFITAWQHCVTSVFDHNLPFFKLSNGDGFLWNYIGEKIPDTDCNYDENCYDGHEGVDFDDYGRCYQNTDVYAVAAGEIVTNETGWRDDGYGYRVVIQHGDTGYKTLYGHLTTILVSSGSVNQDTKIGTIGETGCTGCGTHLHLSVYHDGEVVDPSGWEPLPWFADPNEEENNVASYRLWLYSPTRSTPVNDAEGTSLTSPSGEAIISIPPLAYGDDYEISITEQAPLGLSDFLTSTGHGFFLNGKSFYGDDISSLNQDISLEVYFSIDDLKGIDPRTLSLYSWISSENQWVQIPTNITFPTLSNDPTVQSVGKATSITRGLEYIALLGTPYILHLPILVR